MILYGFLQDEDIILGNDEVRLKNEFDQEYFGPPGFIHKGWEKVNKFMPAYIGRNLTEYKKRLGDTIEIRRKIE